MKTIELWECSACGAYYDDKITACDCYMDGCTTFHHYNAVLTQHVTLTNEVDKVADNSPVIPDRWIPVSERLPEKREGYLVWDGKRCVIASFLSGSFVRNQFFTDEITHWMALPEPPKEVVIAN